MNNRNNSCFSKAEDGVSCDGIRWQINFTHGLCHFKYQYAPCHLVPCYSWHYITWSHFDPLSHCTPQNPTKFLKGVQWLLFLYILWETTLPLRITHKKNPQAKNHFTKSYFSLTVKIYVVFGRLSLIFKRTVIEQN